MVERVRSKDFLDPPTNALSRRDDTIHQHIRMDGLRTDISTPMWLMLPKGIDPALYKDNFPKGINRATVALGIHGYGCQPHNDSNEVVGYYSWLYDHLNSGLGLPSPLLMHTPAFPGTEWDQSARHEHLSKGIDIYSIHHHPAILSNMIDAWIKDARSMLPPNVHNLDAMVIAHSYGGRALMQHLASIVGNHETEHAATQLSQYMSSLAKRNGFDSIKMHLNLLSPAYALSESSNRLLQLGMPLGALDNLVKKSRVGLIYSAYQRVTQSPFSTVTNLVVGSPHLAGKILGIDNTGKFMQIFAAANDPHVLLQHARQLGQPATYRPDLAQIIRIAEINSLTLSGENDSLISNPAIDRVHGTPNSGSTHRRMTGMAHLECLQDPALVAKLIVENFRKN